MEESDTADNTIIHPKETANAISKLFYLWTIPLLFKKSNSNFYAYLKEYDCAILSQNLEIEWTRQCKITKSPSLWKIVFILFYKKIIFIGCLIFGMNTILFIYQPFFINRILEYFTPNQTKWTPRNGLNSILVLTGLWIIQTVVYNYIMAQMHSIGVKFREACSGMVYRRTVYSSKQRLEEFTNLGQIINLLSNDASFIEIGLMRCQFVWITPIQVMVAAACLYFQFGYSAAIGTSVFLLVMICELCLIACSINRKKQVNRVTEQRLQLMNEFISGIQILKVNAWNDHFAAKIMQIRKYVRSRFS